MPLSTFGVVTAVTPSVIETYFSHYLNRAPLRQKPTAHISYHEGLRLIRQFLDYSSKHTVEDLQAFTAQWVPAPTWIRIEDIAISAQYIEKSANLIQQQLGPRGIELVGGKSWWQWRRPDAPLKAEWVEMKKDYNDRKRAGEKADRAILYVHGGAYYFGSVDEHRYQIQRHARKLKARVFAPRYRLAPQFPFPCGLHDCIAAYFQLLEHFEPSQILFGGDSAGGGMVLSMLVTLRDQGQPLPAGTLLLSPWVDLTHSFPSVAGNGEGDYIPPHGFHHKPSMVWPPPNTDELRELATTPIKKKKSKDDLSSMSLPDQDSKVPHVDRDLSIFVNGEKITIRDQIQMYSTNYMLAHPLVSPVQQPSLGGLPPMLIQVGGGELLRDEQIFLAHKAANPTAYPPGERIMNEYGLKHEDVGRYPPTDVQLQVWDDLCHVPQTLSFTRPAKYMYRGVAQFGAWAYANAQQKPIAVVDDDQISIISSGPGTDTEANASSTSLPEKNQRSNSANDAFQSTQPKGQKPTGTIGRAGDPLPPFEKNMIRQRVDRHGVTYHLTRESELPCLQLDPESVGAIKPGPVGKWLTYKRASDSKFASEKKKVQKKRMKEMQQGYQVAGDGEQPPPTALAGRRTADMPAEKRLKKSWGLAMWSGWGSSHDESQLERQDKLEKDPNRPESRQPSAAVTADPAPETTESKPFSAALETNGRERKASSSSIFSGRSKRKERSVSPFVPTSDESHTERPILGGSNLRPPSDTISRSISRTSSYSATTSQRDSEPPAASTTSARNKHMTADSDTLTTLPRVQSPSSDRVQSPTYDAAPGDSGAAESTQDSSSSNLPDGQVVYPFKIRNPVPGHTSSVASSAGDSIDAQTSSTLFPNAGANGTGVAARTHLARPISSLHAFSDKEFVMPAAENEKEVAMEGSSNPGTPTDGRSMPFRMRNAPADPRAPRLDTSNLTTVPTNASQVSSIPPSPAASYRGKAPDMQYRNSPFDPRTVAARVFGGGNSPQSEISNPTDHINAAPPPPKPVGFAYSPRDLRNAMLHRAAAESAAAARNESSGQASPAANHQLSRPFGGAVELPAEPLMAPVSHRPSAETLGRDSTASRTSDQSKTTSATGTVSATGTSNLSELQLPAPDPVELSATPMRQRPLSPPATTQNPASSFNRPDLAVQENITLPVAEQRPPPPRNSVEPPPPPPKDDPKPDGQTPPPRSRKAAEILGKSKGSPVPVSPSAPVIGSIPGLPAGGADGGMEFGLGTRVGEKSPKWI